MGALLRAFDDGARDGINEAVGCDDGLVLKLGASEAEEEDDDGLDVGVGECAPGPLDEGLILVVVCSTLVFIPPTRVVPSLMILVPFCLPLREDDVINIGDDKMPTSVYRTSRLPVSFGVDGATTPDTSCTSCLTDENSSSASVSDARMTAPLVIATNSIDTVAFENRMRG